MTLKEIDTILKETEATINNRPLAYVESDTTLQDTTFKVRVNGVIY